MLLALAANAFADHGDETTFRILAELVVMRGFFTDYEASAAVTGIKPLGRRGGGAIAAVKAHPRTHLHEGSTLRQLCRFLIFHADQGEPLIVLENAYGTHRNFIAGFGLADGPPVSGRENDQAHHQNWRQHNRGKNDKSFFQR
jgi:hypothetical protein